MAVLALMGLGLSLGWYGSWALAALTLIVVASVYYWYPTWQVRKVPVPPYVWGAGHMPLLAKYNGDTFTMLAQKYGKIYRFQMGRTPLVIVADVDLCRQIGEQNFKAAPNRTRPPMVAGSRILGDIMFFLREDQSWLQLRGILMPLFHSERLASFIPLMQRVSRSCNERLVKIAEDQEDVNISSMMQRLTMDVIGEAAFGTKFGLLDAVPGEDEPLVKVVHEAIDALRMDTGVPFSFMVGAMFPILQRPLQKLMLTLPWSQEKYVDNLDTILLKRLNEITEKRMRDKTAVNKIDALSLLLNSKKLNKENKELLTKRHISALTYELLLTGSETTSVTLGNAIYLLAQHPEAEKKLLQEIDANYDPSKPIAVEDFGKFPYVDWVIKETLRVRTPAPITARELVAPVNLAGYQLPKGSHVWLAFGALHVDPKYFPDPLQFKPERWDPNCEESKRRNPNAFNPFGVGPRICIGRKLSIQEATIVLIHLYSEFTFSLSPSRKQIPLEEVFGLVSRPKHGIWVRAHNRR